MCSYSCTQYHNQGIHINNRIRCWGDIILCLLL
nr:MAG TPA: hypothetical protein [Caudoviricetes sp.]